MLDDIQGAHQIEGLVGEGQGCDLTQYGLRAPRVQYPQSGRADVDEVRALDGQARAQARRNFQPSSGRRQQRPHQGPGIETLGLDETGTGPEQIVEAAIVGQELAARCASAQACP